MAFNAFGPGTSVDHAELLEWIIDDSKTISVGDAVKLDTTSGYVSNATAGAPMLGIVVGFTNSVGGTLPGGTYVAGTATASDVVTVVATATNTTTDKKMAIIETSTKKKWSAAVNGTVGTTVHSNLIGAGIDVDSANTNYARVLESTATRTAATVTNFMGWGVDPNDSTRIIVSIASSCLSKDVS